MKKITDEYTCDRCGTKASKEHDEHLPAEWAVVDLGLPSGRKFHFCSIACHRDWVNTDPDEEVFAGGDVVNHGYDSDLRSSDVR